MNESISDLRMKMDIEMKMGMKHDTAKPRMDLIPPKAERLLAEVLTFGATKYAPDNWRKVDNADSRYLAAAMRHINAHRSGELIDRESGLPHLAHAMCSLAFLIELQGIAHVKPNTEEQD